MTTHEKTKTTKKPKKKVRTDSELDEKVNEATNGPERKDETKEGHPEERRLTPKNDEHVNPIKNPNPVMDHTTGALFRLAVTVVLG